MANDDRNALIDEFGSIQSDLIPPNEEENVLEDRMNELIQQNTNRFPQYVAALAAALGACAAGAVLGWTSPIMDEMQNGKYRDIPINEDQMGWIGSLATLGAMVMCVPAGFICDKIGRKRTLVLQIVPYLTGWMLLLYANSVYMLYFGRFITGMAAGACCVVIPIYTNEIAISSIRGSLGSYFQVMMTLGIFLSYLFGSLFNSFNYTNACAVISLVFAFAISYQPESPVYYLKQGDVSQAAESQNRLGRFLGDGDFLSNLANSMLNRNNAQVSLIQTFKRKGNLKALMFTMVLMLAQQLCGINAIILYSSNIFEEAKVKLDANTAAILVAASQVIATFSASFVIDKISRRHLLITSSFIMAISTTLLAVFFTLKYRYTVDDSVMDKIGFLPVTALISYLIMFSVGLGPIPWIITTEMFKPELKSIATSAAGTVNWGLAFLVTKFYLQICDLIGQDSTFYIFSAASLCGTVFFYFVLPETKGKSPYEIQEELEN